MVGFGASRDWSFVLYARGWGLGALSPRQGRGTPEGVLCCVSAVWNMRACAAPAGDSRARVQASVAGRDGCCQGTGAAPSGGMPHCSVLEHALQLPGLWRFLTDAPTRSVDRAEQGGSAGLVFSKRPLLSCRLMLPSQPCVCVFQGRASRLRKPHALLWVCAGRVRALWVVVWLRTQTWSAFPAHMTNPNPLFLYLCSCGDPSYCSILSSDCTSLCLCPAVS